jgi:hypothetical protein
MNIFDIINNLYTNKKGDWILELEDSEIQPFLVNRFLAMNDDIRVQTRWLDKYVFNLPSKMFLSLAWSIIPKRERAPFIKYIKQIDTVDKYDFILKKVRRQFEMSDNDFNKVKDRIIAYIEKNKMEWFAYYGIEKGLWKAHYLDFNYMKNYKKKDILGWSG